MLWAGGDCRSPSGEARESPQALRRWRRGYKKDHKEWPMLSTLALPMMLALLHVAGRASCCFAWRRLSGMLKIRAERSIHGISHLNSEPSYTLPGRLELPTLRSTASRSSQLSYGSHASSSPMQHPLSYNCGQCLMSTLDPISAPTEPPPAKNRSEGGGERSGPRWGGGGGGGGAGESGGPHV